MAAGARFPTTQWNLVLAATSPDARHTALAELCSAYWPPVYGFIRAQVHDSEQAKDLTQAFFLRLLEKRDFGRFRVEHARFRSFLLASVKHFLSNSRDRSRAEKRGGGRETFPLDFDGCHLSREPIDFITPERIFEKHWATTMLNRALLALRREFEISGRDRQFDALKGCLTGDAQLPRYRQAGAALQMSEGAVKLAVHRMRARFRDILREEIGQTVSGPGEVDEELRFLISIMCS